MYFFTHYLYFKNKKTINNKQNNSQGLLTSLLKQKYVNEGW